MTSITRTRRTLGAVATLVASALFLAGCAGSGGDTATSEPNLDTVKLDMSLNVTSIDPTNNPYLVDNQIVGLTSASLFAFTRGSAVETEPILAESIEASADSMTHTVTLKEGLTFSDASPLTSTEVAASLLRLRDLPGPNQAEVANFADVVATDPTTITITLTQPIGDLAQTLALPATAIVAPAAADNPDYFDGTPIFSGPYVIEGDVKSNAYALVRNENYGGPIPVVNRFEISVVTDPVSSATRLQGGEIDVLPDLPLESAAQTTGEATALTVERTASMYLVPNNRPGALFDDPKLREAIAWAIDRQALGSIVYGENATVLSGPYPGPADYPMPVDVFPAQDTEKAKELFKGTKCENGCDFTVNYFSADSQTVGRAALVLQQQLEPFGITIQAQPVEAQQFIQNSLDGSFDMNVVESGSFNVPASFAGAFESEFTSCIYSGCVSPTFQPLVDELLGATDEAQQNEASAKILEEFKTWVPIIPVAPAVGSFGVRTNLVDTITFQPNMAIWVATS